MPTFNNLESLASVRQKINDAIVLAEETAVDLAAEIGLAQTAATQSQGYATVSQEAAATALSAAAIAQAYGTMYTETDLELSAVAIPANVDLVARICATAGQVAPEGQLSWWIRNSTPGSDPYFTTSGGVTWTEVGLRSQDILAALNSAIAALGTEGQRIYANRAAAVSALSAGVPATVTRVGWFTNFLGSAHVATVFVTRKTGSTVISDMHDWTFDRVPFAEIWGAVSYATKAAAEAGTDSAAAVQAAVDAIGQCHFLHGYYAIGSTITIATDGGGLFAPGGEVTFLVGTATTGPVVRHTRDNIHMRGFRIDAGTTRAAVSFSPLIGGLLCEPEDIPDTTNLRVRNCDFYDFGIINQPGHAAILSGPAFTGQWYLPWISNNKGDAIVCDFGYTTGRSNIDTDFVPGLLTIHGGEITHNGGHAFRGGDSADGTSGGCVRIRFENVEIGNNATNASVRKAPVHIYFNGSTLSATDCIFTSDTADVISAFKVLGRDIRFIGNRYVGLKYLGFVSSHDSTLTQDVIVDGGTIINPVDGTSMGTGIVVMLEAGQTKEPRGITVRGMSGVIDKYVAPDNVTISGTQTQRLEEVHTSRYVQRYIEKDSDQAVTNSITLVDDNDLKLWMRANNRVSFRFLIVFSASSSAGDIRLRVEAPSGATVEYATPSAVKYDNSDTISHQAVVTNTSIISLAATTTKRMVEIAGYCTNASTAGYLKLQFAQATADASTITVHRRASNLTVWERAT